MHYLQFVTGEYWNSWNNCRIGGLHIRRLYDCIYYGYGSLTGRVWIKR